MSVRTLLYGAVALVGGVIGAASVTFLGPLVTPKAEAASRATTLAEAQERLAELSSGQESARARLAALETNARLLAASQNRASSSVEASAEKREPAAAPMRPSVEDQRREHEAQLAAHAAEPVDVTWARDKSVQIRSALDALKSPGDMTVSQFECRSTTCLARLTWPTRDAAMDSRRQVVTLLTGDVGCERYLYLGAEGQRPDGFDGTLLLDCPR